MPKSNPTTTLNDAIPGSLANDFMDSLQHQRSRLVIKEVVQECIDSSVFADRVENILLHALESDSARQKLQKWVTGIVQSEVTTYNSIKTEKNWSRIIGVGGVLVGVAGVVVAIVALYVNN
jgi:hypothetical protein